MEKKQTAVMWLISNLALVDNSPFQAIAFYHDNKDMIEKAKEIEKEQMDIVAGDWWNEGASYMYDGKRKYESFEQYYNETYLK